MVDNSGRGEASGRDGRPHTAADVVRHAVWPGTAARDGRFVPALLALTVVTGLVDAVSYLGLGRVFVANMTGNVVFLGFACAGAPGLSAAASLVSLGGFVVGAFGGGRLHLVTEVPRARLFATAVAGQAVLLAAATGIAAAGKPFADGVRYGLIALLGVAMGLQNAVVRRLAVPDLTTTVLTQTLTGFAADTGDRRRAARRLASAVAMFLGALAGALLVLRADLAPALGTATALVALLAVVSWGYLRRRAR
ncbi:YoaK family protein [Yinghuangia aomiensis]|uniref:YoaK family protein n=1 Tax=Yinghuangia aomiensis TaxID=676205 RepID=A0ABP9GMS3_9ACTN